MTTDREQLELAAKAAGYWSSEYQCPDKLPRPGWDPSADDGDEARLEAALMLEVGWGCGYAFVTNRDGTAQALEFFSDHNGDRQAARRAAGVRVAAEIGRKM